MEIVSVNPSFIPKHASFFFSSLSQHITKPPSTSLLAPPLALFKVDHQFPKSVAFPAKFFLITRHIAPDARLILDLKVSARVRDFKFSASYFCSGQKSRGSYEERELTEKLFNQGHFIPILWPQSYESRILYTTKLFFAGMLVAPQSHGRLAKESGFCVSRELMT